MRTFECVIVCTVCENANVAKNSSEKVKLHMNIFNILFYSFQIALALLWTTLLCKIELIASHESVNRQRNMGLTRIFEILRNLIMF